MIIHCPHCKTEKELEHKERGRHVKCTACGTLFTLDDATVLRDYSEIDPRNPEKIGPYPIERFLGKGSLGSVYKGKHPELGIPVAVRILPREYAANKIFRKRFEESSRIAAAIDHPNIVKVFHAGTDENGHLYLAMEYVAGGTVQDMLNRSGVLSPEKTAEIAIAICSALTAAQKNGIVYRDIRPDNIMITSNGGYKLANPGLAKSCAEVEEKAGAKRNVADNKEETLELISLGTPEYMAPEQSIDANHCDIRADIYSLGVSMYQMLSGHLPFETENRNELRRRHFEVEPKIPSIYRADIPVDMEYIVMLCLRKKKTERYQTPDELLTDLDAFMDGLPPPSANDNTLVSEGKSYGTHIPRGKDILIRSNRPLFRLGILNNRNWNWFRLAEIAAIVILTFATIWLLWERNHGETAKQGTQHLTGSYPNLIINRADIWESSRKKAKEALRKKRGFSDAILNLKAFENDKDPERKKEAKRLLDQLNSASVIEVNKMMKGLDRDAQQYCEKQDYHSAIAVYEDRRNPLYKEIRNESEIRIAKIRKLAEEYSKQQKKNQEYLEKYVIPHLAAENYAIAMKWYKHKDNPGIDDAVKIILNECIRIPEKFAESNRTQINMECKYIFRTEPFESWSKQDNMKIMRVDQIYVYLHGHEGNPFTIHDLTPEEQDFVISEIKEISESARALWNIGVNCYSAPEKAERYVSMLPFSLRESYMTYLKNRIMSRLIDSFRKDLRSLLADVGYSSNDLPGPEQLPDLRVFFSVEPEPCIQRIDSILKTYDALPAEERGYLEALKNIRLILENQLHINRLHQPNEREFQPALQEIR